MVNFVQQKKFEMASGVMSISIKNIQTYMIPGTWWYSMEYLKGQILPGWSREVPGGINQYWTYANK